jgi:hypothetical protein
VRRDLLLCPLVIFHRANDELDFVRGFELHNVFPAVARHLAARRAFQIHDSPDAGINFRNVLRAAGFHEHGPYYNWLLLILIYIYSNIRNIFHWHLGMTIAI